MREGKKAAPAAVAGPVAVIRFERGTTGRENEMPRVVSCNRMPDGEYEVYLSSAAPTAHAAPQPADPQELLPEIARLQRALAFWLPMGPSEDHPLQERIAHDAFLLAGYYGPDEPSAYELGHVALAGTAAPVAQGDALTTAARDVLAERQRQISAEGWTPEHDDEYLAGELALAAASYVCADEGDAPPAIWPWDWSRWKPRDRRRNLVKSGALILAELEHIDRAAARALAKEGGAA